MKMAGTQPEHPMILGNCISCNGLMRVPVTTDVTHVARCPHCEIRFPVQQLIASAIPAAEIIKGVVREDITPIVDRVRDQSDDEDKPRTKFEVPKQLHDGAKHRRRRRRRSRGSDERKDRAIKESGRPESSRSSSGATQPKINPASVPLASTQSAASAEVAEAADVGVLDEVPMRPASSSPSYSAGDSSSSDSSSRSRSESRSSGSRSSSRRSSSRHVDETSDNAALEWLKIVFGGMLALPLAYLGLMWIAGLDPFGVANQINNVAPILVPDSMIDEDFLPTTDEDDLEAEEAEGLPKPSIDPDDVRG